MQNVSTATSLVFLLLVPTIPSFLVVVGLVYIGKRIDAEGITF